MGAVSTPTNRAFGSHAEEGVKIGAGKEKASWRVAIRSLFLLVFILICAAGVYGCGEPGAIGGRYEIRGNQGDIILDTVTGLEWQRCSLGPNLEWADMHG